MNASEPASGVCASGARGRGVAGAWPCGSWRRPGGGPGGQGGCVRGKPSGRWARGGGAAFGLRAAGCMTASAAHLELRALAVPLRPAGRRDGLRQVEVVDGAWLGGRAGPGGQAGRHACGAGRLCEGDERGKAAAGLDNQYGGRGLASLLALSSPSPPTPPPHRPAPPRPQFLTCPPPTPSPLKKVRNVTSRPSASTARTLAVTSIPGSSAPSVSAPPPPPPPGESLTAADATASWLTVT